MRGCPCNQAISECVVMVFQVVCVAHSSASIDGRPDGPNRSYWVALVKDVEQKGYFIRIVDKEVRAC